MSDAVQTDPLREFVRRHPAAREIVSRWRAASPRPRPTLVACSGGADSTALLLALWSTNEPVCVGHVVHDMRSRAESLADRDRVAGLAARLGVRFVCEEVSARGCGENLEAAYRRLRYAALVKAAASLGLGIVATGHHAGDQAETVLMRLLRGAGPRGLGGMRARRVLSTSPRVVHVRPALAVDPAGLRDLCVGAGVAWSEDATNRDVGRLRAAIRHSIIPGLVALSPAAMERIGTAAELCAEAADFVREAGEAALSRGTRDAHGLVFGRAELRGLPAAVVGECIRLAAGEGGPGGDRLRWRVVRPVALAIKDGKEHRREFRVGLSLCVVDASRILIRAYEEPKHEPAADWDR
ncbi:MAG: tRNA lysidine(34) synthetase TilS [Phycisphaerales bacterium]